jgi:hypothetical protein
MRNFRARRLETPPRNSTRKSVLDLIADGRELAARLAPALAARGEERAGLLGAAVRPYLQLVEANEPDPHTGIPLGEVWRYFRYTWSLPLVGIPGRQLFYLVRDAAHPCHAVMGIVALSNSAMQMKERDDFIGWTADAFEKRIEHALTNNGPAQVLTDLHASLENHIAAALGDIAIEGLAKPREIENPTPEIVARLRRRSKEFATSRKDALTELLGDDVPQTMQETEAGEYGAPPDSEEVLSLEAKVHAMKDFRKSRQLMVAKKRAFELARLLQARFRLRAAREDLVDPARVLAALGCDETRVAISTALLAAKGRRVGTNMLELTTCGAIAPYNGLLGGKLTALLMLSPQVADDYRRRYGAAPSFISSLLKNAPLTRDCTLTYIGTTSLYALGSSQYERLRLPAGLIAPDQPELRYGFVGYMGGYGTVQFAPETARALESVVERQLGFQDVNSIFGEGPSPRLRKLRTGLALLGFNPDNLLKHNQHRLIYAVELAKNARAFLRGETDALPAYLTQPDQFRDATERIAEFWRQRWLARRLDHTPTVETLALTKPWKLSDQIPAEAAAPELRAREEPAPPSPPRVTSASPAVEFWRSLAFAGPEVCSDELTDEEMDRLHVGRTLENFLIERIGQGSSLVFTGNAGDGKTHLLRRLQQRIGDVANSSSTRPPPCAAASLAPCLTSGASRSQPENLTASRPTNTRSTSCTPRACPPCRSSPRSIASAAHGGPTAWRHLRKTPVKTCSSSISASATRSLPASPDSFSKSCWPTKRCADTRDPARNRTFRRTSNASPRTHASATACSTCCAVSSSGASARRSASFGSCSPDFFSAAGQCRTKSPVRSRRVTPRGCSSPTNDSAFRSSCTITPIPHDAAIRSGTPVSRSPGRLTSPTGSKVASRASACASSMRRRLPFSSASSISSTPPAPRPSLLRKITRAASSHISRRPAPATRCSSAKSCAPSISARFPPVHR